jgi:phosphate/sulfate permease
MRPPPRRWHWNFAALRIVKTMGMKITKLRGGLRAETGGAITLSCHRTRVPVSTTHTIRSDIGVARQ